MIDEPIADEISSLDDFSDNDDPIYPGYVGDGRAIEETSFLKPEIWEGKKPESQPVKEKGYFPKEYSPERKVPYTYQPPRHRVSQQDLEPILDIPMFEEKDKLSPKTWRKPILYTTRLAALHQAAKGEIPPQAVAAQVTEETMEAEEIEDTPENREEVYDATKESYIKLLEEQNKALATAIAATQKEMQKPSPQSMTNIQRAAKSSLSTHQVPPTEKNMDFAVQQASASYIGQSQQKVENATAKIESNNEDITQLKKSKMPEWNGMTQNDPKPKGSKKWLVVGGLGLAALLYGLSVKREMA